MSESLWSLPAAELLRRTASSEPTPGSGSVAAVAGALGIGLVRMALEITDDAPAALRRRGEAIMARVAAAADDDVAGFSAVIDARGMPQGDDAERAARDAAVDAATIAATELPLALVEALVDALRLAAEAEPLVQHVVVSDVLAGADLVGAAALAAIRAADLNIDTLEQRGVPVAGRLRERRDALVRELESHDAA